MRLMDCTLRDGANVVGKGFSAELTELMIQGLLDSGITLIEMGNALGLGAYEANASIAPLTDEEYMAIAKPYLARGEIGMFMGWKNGSQENIDRAVAGNMAFLRIGANAGDAALAAPVVRRVKESGLRAFFSQMKGYVLPSDKLADEAALLEQNGLDLVTIMDSAGTMTPTSTYEYVAALKKAVSIPVAFHGHNNLGLASANAIAAADAGADVVDCGLMGMARSAGNIATELAVALYKDKGLLPEVDEYALLHFIDSRLMPAMAKHGYKPAVAPLDLVYGWAGCHSSFAAMFAGAAEKYGVDLYRLIVEVSRIDRKSPSEQLIAQVAQTLQ